MTIRESRVLVIGGTGFVGRAVARAFASAGAEIWLASRSGSASPLVQTVDVTDADSVQRCVEAVRPHVVVQAAGLRSAEPLAMFDANCAGTMHVLSAVRAQAPQARVVLIGSAAQYAPSPAGQPISELGPIHPTTPYGATKTAEILLGRSIGAALGLDVRAAILFNLAGLGQPDSLLPAAMVRQVAEIELGRREPRLVVGDISTERDYVDVRDAADAIVAVADRGRPGEAYNVASGVATSGRAMLKLLAAKSQSWEVIEDLSLRRSGDIARVVGDPTKIRTELDWRPAMRLDQSLEDSLEDWRARLATDRNGERLGEGDRRVEGA